MQNETMAFDILPIRLHNQQLVNSQFKSPEDLVAWMGAIQAQQPEMAKLALALRLQNGAIGHINEAINQAKIIRTHVLRPTWHLVTPQDIRWMLQLSYRRLKNTYYTYEKGSGLLSEGHEWAKHLDMLADFLYHQHLTRQRLSELFTQKLGKLHPHFMTSLLLNAELEGIVCSGKQQQGKHTYTLMDEWVPPYPVPTHEEALALLARKYFQSHGPACFKDFLWWSGLSITEAREALTLIGHELQKVVYGDEDYFLFEQPITKGEWMESVTFLPAYDEYIIAYNVRKDVFRAKDMPKAFTKNGLFFPLVLVNGKAIGTWKLKNKKLPMPLYTMFEGIKQPRESMILQAIEEFSLHLGMGKDMML